MTAFVGKNRRPNLKETVGLSGSTNGEYDSARSKFHQAVDYSIGIVKELDLSFRLEGGPNHLLRRVGQYIGLVVRSEVQDIGAHMRANKDGPLCRKAGFCNCLCDGTG